jgi:hypothetical protein
LENCPGKFTNFYWKIVLGNSLIFLGKIPGKTSQNFPKSPANQATSISIYNLKKTGKILRETMT